ncbi:hypothetical protein ACLI4R_14425 [Natrialbaceae archaeon A-chndr2]
MEGQLVEDDTDTGYITEGTNEEGFISVDPVTRTPPTQDTEEWLTQRAVSDYEGSENEHAQLVTDVGERGLWPNHPTGGAETDPGEDSEPNRNPLNNYLTQYGEEDEDEEDGDDTTIQQCGSTATGEICYY